MATTMNDIRNYLSQRGWKPNPHYTKYFYPGHSYPHLHLDLKDATGKSKVMYWIKYFGYSETVTKVRIADKWVYDGHNIISLPTMDLRNEARAIIDGEV